MIDKKFLENNLFKEAKIGAGSFPWYYSEAGKYSITINQWCCQRHSIHIENFITHKSLCFESELKLLKEDLRKCMVFMEISDKFNYDL